MGITFNPFTGTLDFTGGAGGGGGTPSAPDTSVQYNDGGSFGGDSGLTWDDDTGQFAIGKASVTGIGAVQFLQASDSTTTPSDSPEWYIVGGDDVSPQIVGLVSGGSLATPATAVGDEPLLISGRVWNGAAASPAYQEIAQIVFRQDGSVSAAGSPGQIVFKVRDASGNGVEVLAIRQTGISEFAGNVQIADGKAFTPDTTTAHTALLQAYDVDGTAYKTFATLLNGNVPRFTISQPVGGLLAMIAPTTDPGVTGALWNDNGAPAFSA